MYLWALLWLSICSDLACEPENDFCLLSLMTPGTSPLLGNPWIRPDLAFLSGSKTVLFFPLSPSLSKNIFLMPVIGFDLAFGRLKLSEVHKNESGDRHLSGSKTFFSPVNFFEGISSAHLLSFAWIRIT